MGDVTFTAQTKFENAMRLELNQNKPLLSARTPEKDCKGAEKKKLDNLISQAKMKRKTARKVDVEYDETGWDGIWIAKPDPYYLATEIDNEDKLVTEVDIEGGELMKHSAAYNRAWDDAWLEGFFGDLITGKTGTVLNPFPTGNIVDAAIGSAGGATDVGMKVKKIKRARRILAGNFVDMQQQFYMALGSEQIENLFDEIEATNQDYKQLGVRLSPDGKHLLGMLGFEFIEMELGNPLLDNSAMTEAGGYRLNPFWTADGMVTGVWEKLFTSVDPLPGRHHDHQVYTRCVMASSRTDQNRCGYLENVEV